MHVKTNQLISMKNIFVFICFFTLFNTPNLFAQTDMEFIQKIDSSLVVLTNLASEAKHLHPCLTEFHPVAVAYKDSLFIFDYNKEKGKYEFIIKTAQPFPIPEGMEASFPLSAYDNIPSCIITPKTFNSDAGYATILHEFIHCCQFSSVEPALKQELEIYRAAMEKQDYSWEIMHPFPYEDSLFINYYGNLKNALAQDVVNEAKQFRLKIKNHLSKIDFEYLLWQEWKEGLARYVENKVRNQLGITANNYGSDTSYNRAAFYYSGELLIKHLEKDNPALPEKPEQLFEMMKNFHVND